MVIVVTATFPVASDKQDEAAEAVEELVESSREEEGVLEYHASRDVEDASLFRFFEKYESPEDFESHTRTKHFGEFEEKLPDLLDGEPRATRFSVSSESELDL